MFLNDQGDVLLFQTPNQGDINIEDGFVEMSGGLGTAAYISLFGGNIEDDGSQDTNKGYWGNVIEPIATRRLVSRTQFLLRSIPLTSSNLLRIEDAATQDLQWMLDTGIASSVSVSATVQGLNKLELTINIEAVGQQDTFKFIANWEARS